MSTTMNKIYHIRERFYQQGKNISQITSETGLNRKNVSKYVDMTYFRSPADFRFAHFYKNDYLYETAKYLILSFSYSNSSFL